MASQHGPMHFPNWKSPEIKRQLDDFVDSCINDNEFVAKLHQEFLKFWAMLHSAEKTSTDRQRIKEVKTLYDKMLNGNKEHKLYFLTQLIKGFETLNKDKLPAALFRYNGKAKMSIRHFDPSRAHGTSGDVARQISQIVTAHRARENTAIQEDERLYAWVALKVPSNSADALEQAIMMALWNLNERSPSYWNMRITALKRDNPFADTHPRMLTLVGLYALHQICENFSAKDVKKYQELLTTYDNFSESDKEAFHLKYTVVTNDARDADLATLRKMIQEIRIIAETQNNVNILQIINQADATTLLGPAALDDQLNEASEDDAEESDS